MDEELESGEISERGVSKKDQLTYRVTIQNIVDRCFLTLGTYGLAHHVTALRTALFFQIPGLPFKDRILEKEKDLDEKKQQKIEERKKEKGRSFYKNATKAKFRIEIKEWYWQTLLEYLLDLLAEHDALMKAKQYVEIGEAL